ncbi:MAG: hypothetical protein UZ11_BCD004001825 [Bacteroidetes bacterium OLB11]|nr:MAG: hypothetical protein UZ11_BCD004001825 [Bacteroidetes bacterium OLB11]
MPKLEYKFRFPALTHTMKTYLFQGTNIEMTKTQPIPFKG